MKSQPITKKDRIISLDIIRGLALFGILFINVPAYLVFIENGPEPDLTGVNGVIKLFIVILIEKKFFSIFSFLFGVGAYIFMSRAEQRGDRYLLRFSRRMLILLLFGIIHVFIWFGDILFVYAILGLLLIPFYNRKQKTILSFAVILTVLSWLSMGVNMIYFNQGIDAPQWMQFFSGDQNTIFAMFLFGMYAGKSGIIKNITNNAGLLKKIQVIMFLLFMTFTAIITWLSLIPQTDQVSLFTSAVVGMGAVPMTFFYLTTLFLLLEKSVVQKFLSPVGFVGQMAFTNYLCQDSIGRFILNQAGIEVVSPHHTIIVAIAIFVIQLIFSVVWLKVFKFRYGPLEYVWRTLTYGKLTRKGTNITA